MKKRKEPRLPFAEALARWKREYFLAALDEAGGHQGLAADLTGVHRNTIHRLLREAGLTRYIIRAHRLGCGLTIVRRKKKEIQ